MMTVQEMREKKRKYGYTYAEISQLSGIPVGTIQKIFRGETLNPRYQTVQALERAFLPGQNPDELRETVFYGHRRHRKYAIRLVCWDMVFAMNESVQK